MKNKYYTPSIDEFYLGFEYYFKNSNEQPPSYYSYEEFGRYETLDELEDQILNDNIKVKYLDQNDIESLGWGQDDYDGTIFYKEKYTLIFNIFDFQESFGCVILETIDLKECTIFSGYIKNKNELKKLMKQIGTK